MIDTRESYWRVYVHNPEEENKCESENVSDQDTAARKPCVPSENGTKTKRPVAS